MSFASFTYITGDIIGYAHDFSNTAYFEKAISEIPFIAHNFIGFDLFYWIKNYIASAWCSKELNIAGNNLTHAKFGNINNEIKVIDSLKFYQRSLSELSSTLIEQEKAALKSLAEKFLNEHYYFSTVLAYFSSGKKTQNFRNYFSRKNALSHMKLLLI